jgi:hypothetical protein
LPEFPIVLTRKASNPGLAGAITRRMRADPQEIQMRSETAPAIRLEDYQPPAYRIDAVHLNVDLHPSATEVTATLNVCRQPEPPPERRSSSTATT